MSFGFGVSDFLAVIKLANEIRSRFVDAPDQFSAISNEIKSLSNVLRDIDDVLPQRDLSDQQQAEFGETIQSCEGVLTDLEATLSKYQELDPTPKHFAGRSRRVWKRLIWDQKDIDKFRTRVTSHVLTLNTFLERINSRAIIAAKVGVDQLVSRQHDEDRHAILNWLTPIDYALQQSDFMSKRQKGTGQWLLASHQFRDWVDQSGQTLFCPGLPGAGKTMCTAIVIEELCNRFQNDSHVVIAYVYCNFRRQNEQKSGDLLRNLLKQLVWGRQPVPQSILSLYERHQKQRTQPSTDEISHILQSVVRDYSKTFIIVDALDECQAKDGEQKLFLAELFNLQAKTAINLFVTSRFIPEIEKEFDGRSTKLKIRATDEDLRKYLDQNILKLPRFVSRSADLQEEIKTTILDAADGIFLLAQLHLDSLMGEASRKAIRKALRKLRKGSEAYDQAYSSAMERIEGQVPASKSLAKAVLSWITCVKRPLTALELQHALAVEINEPELDDENLPEIEDMVSVCAGLVTVDEHSTIIRLVHYTAQEFFERTQGTYLPEAQVLITKVCFTYLSFDIFSSGVCQSDEEFEARLQSNPLYDYAARNWGHHARESNAHDLNMGFLENEAKVGASSQALMAKEDYRYSGFSQAVPNEMMGMHLTAWFGLTEITDWLIKKGHPLNCKNSYGQTPLLWAAKNGHKATVQLLLEKGAELESKDTAGQTPLSWAARSGHEAMVQLLLERGAELESKDTGGRKPLSWAVENGHEVVVQLLLEKGAELESKDTAGQTPLSWAARSGHEAMVQLLLEKGAELESKDDDCGQTPLSWAARNGHEVVVQLLLEKGAELESKDTDGQTPLSWAAWNGHEVVVQLLLEKGAELESKDDYYGHTPLLWAIENGRKATVKLLLEKGAKLKPTDDIGGETPLLWAIRHKQKAMVQLLLEKGARLESKDTAGYTPLS